MKAKSTNQSILFTNPIVIALITAVIILGGGILFILSNNKTSNSSASRAPQLQTESETETMVNPQYGHVHALFKVPGTNTFLMGTHKGLFQSLDNGKTFTQAEAKGVMQDMEFMNFAYDPNTETLFAGGHDLGVVKSMDNGVTWEKADSGITGKDIHALAINSLDTKKVYAFSVGMGVFGSQDGGKSWNRIDDGPANPSVRSFGYMATASDMDRSMGTDKTSNIGYLWAGTGGGLFSSFACFCGWTKTEGISSNATIYTLAPDPVNKSSMLAGTKDGIYKTTDEGKNFTQVSKDIKNVAAITFDEKNQTTVYAVTEDGIIYKSMDSGNTWNTLQ